MADAKLTGLTELTTLDGDEQFYVVDDDDGTPTSKRITKENLQAGLVDATADALTDAIADGDAATLTSAQTYADGKVAQSITNGVTTSAPSQDQMFDALALKADLASPTFTGTPAAPTAAQGTNTTQVATTAFVQTEIAADAAPLRLTVNAQTGTTYTPVLSDEQKLVTLSNAAAITVTMPQDSAVAIPVGGQIHFTQLGAGQVTFSAGTGATVNATPGAKTRAQYSTVTAIKRAADTWILVGDLAA